MVPTSSAARQLVEPIFDSLMSLGDGGTASCKLSKAQVGSGVVGGGREGGGALLGWVRGGSDCSASALNKLH